MYRMISRDRKEQRRNRQDKEVANCIVVEYIIVIWQQQGHDNDSWTIYHE